MKKILIADNSEQFGEQLVQAIKKLEMCETVGVANDGEQAVRMVKKLTPDILVLDLMLAKLDGLGVLKEINTMEHRPVVIATSRFVTDYVASAAANLGVRYLMLKPCDVDALIERIEECCVWNTFRGNARKAGETKSEILVTGIIRDIGVPAHIKGYQYLREAVMIAVEDPDVINALTKVLYPQVARTFQTTPARVMRAIQHAIEVAWDRGDLDTLQRFFGHSVSNIKGKPTNREFISVIADQIRLWMKENAGQLK